MIFGFKIFKPSHGPDMGKTRIFSRPISRMWPLTIALGLVIAYFILKLARIQINKTYISGQSYYKSGPTVVPSPLPVDNALIGVGLETRVTPPSVMDSGSPVSMVMMNPSPSPVVMNPSPSPMVEPMVMSPAPSPMSVSGNGPVAMTMVPSPAPSV